MVDSSVAVGSGLSIGYVAWLIRSGVVLSTVLSSLPAWRFIDPTPVLSSMVAVGNDEDDESLESIVAGEDSEAPEDQEDSPVAEDTEGAKR